MPAVKGGLCLASVFLLTGVVRFQWKGNRSFSLCVNAL